MSAGTTVCAWCSLAVVQWYFTVGSGVLGWTIAGVTSLAGVEASTAVSTWFVVGTEVEVLVAEQTTPTFVAEAVPRLHARAMHTTWIFLAFVTQRTFPTGLTFALVWHCAMSMFFITTR